jgi:hypothetical protein
MELLMIGFNRLLNKYWVTVSTLIVAAPLVTIAFISAPVMGA